MVDREAVIAWQKANNAKIIDVVRHFYGADCTTTTHRAEYMRVRHWLQRKVKRPHKPVKGSKAPEAAPAIRASSLVEELQIEIEHAEEARTRMAADHSWSAWQLTSRYLRQLREQMRELRTQRAEDFDPTDDEQVIAAVLALPPRYLADDRVLQAVIQARDE